FGQIVPHVERPHPEHHRIQPRQPLRRQVLPLQRRHLVPHLPNALRHAVPRPRHESHLLPPRHQVQAHPLHPTRRLPPPPPPPPPPATNPTFFPRVTRSRHTPFTRAAGCSTCGGMCGYLISIRSLPNTRPPTSTSAPISPTPNSFGAVTVNATFARSPG